MRAKDNRTRGAMRPALLLLALTIAAVAVFMGGMASKTTARAENIYGLRLPLTLEDGVFKSKNINVYDSRFQICYLFGDHTKASREYSNAELEQIYKQSKSTVYAPNLKPNEDYSFSLRSFDTAGIFGGNTKTWEELHNAWNTQGLTFMLRGPFSAGGTLVECYSAPIFIEPRLKVPEKEGHIFVGWFLDAAFTQPYTNQPITSDTVLYAKYEPIQCHIHLNVNGGEPLADITLDYGTVPNIPTPTREGYTFRNWFLGNGQQYTPTAIKGDITLTAAWQIKVYTVTFDANGGTALSPKNYNHGTALGELPTPTREGYDFVCWHYENDSHSPNAETAVIQNMRLVAEWSIKSFTLTLDAAGGEFDGSNTVNGEYGDSVSLPAPERLGYIFKGWYNGNEKCEDSVILSSDMTLTAHWEIIRCKVTFIIDGEVFQEITVDYGTTLQLAMKEANLTYYNAYNDSGEVIGKGAVITENASVLVGEMSKEERFGAFMANNTWVLWTLGGVAVAGILAAVVACVVAHKRK